MQEKTNLDKALQLGLNEAEYHRILEILQKTPTFIELCLFAAMWSEHCSYKNSIFWLQKLPRSGPQILNAGKSENAGLVDIGGDYACAFKIESHNHPSAIEPFQGAATGVGGINRDIFTMGARPFAQLISLRFGDLSANEQKTNRLTKGVIQGISHYGNALGIPVVGGDIFFNSCYNHTPLVNVLSAGLVKKSEIANAIASGEGNPVFIAGSTTGKDGINGAIFASANINDESDKQIPAIQVGDPFAEKLLMEAALEAIQAGDILAIQDMGAAGIICSTSEMSARGNCGMQIHLDRVPLRNKNMKAEEILLSESQERMLIILEKGKEEKVQKIFEKWKVNLVQIGEVINKSSLQFLMNNEIIADLNPQYLVAGYGAPVYQREFTKPDYFKSIEIFDIEKIPQNISYQKEADTMLQLLNLCDKNWAFKQFDSMIGITNLNTNSEYNANLIKIKETNQILALSISGNENYVQAHPEIGTMIAVAEAAAQIYCSGAKPLAITNGLNFGNPYDTDVYWQFTECIKGLCHASEKFKTPVSGGNVSFYNQYEIENINTPIFPTPIIGMLGILENEKKPIPSNFQKEGDEIYILGKIQNDLSSSTYAKEICQIKFSPAPHFNIDDELQMMHYMYALSENNVLQSAQRISKGGLYIALIKSTLKKNFGIEISTSKDIRKDAFLFGESQGRILISVQKENEKNFKTFCIEKNIPFLKIGSINSTKNICIDDTSYGNIEEMKTKYKNAFRKKMDKF